jgi:hypothetical protein
MNKSYQDVETCRWGGHAVQLPCSDSQVICKPVHKFDTKWNFHGKEVYLLYTILYLSVYSISSNLISSLMIANSKIAVFPDPVGADTTIDTSVREQSKFLTITMLRPQKEVSWTDFLYISLKLLRSCSCSWHLFFRKSFYKDMEIVILITIKEEQQTYRVVYIQDGRGNFVNKRIIYSNKT